MSEIIKAEVLRRVTVEFETAVKIDSSELEDWVRHADNDPKWEWDGDTYDVQTFIEGNPEIEEWPDLNFQDLIDSELVSVSVSPPPKPADEVPLF